MSQSILLAAVLLLGAPLAVPAGDPPAMPDLSADLVMTTKDAPTMNGKFYVSGGRIRNEIHADQGRVVTLIDPTAKKTWILMPPPMGCMEQPMDPDAAGPFDASTPAVKEELLGEETIDGHPTKKYRVTTRVNGETHTMLQWRATDLKNVAIQWTDENGESRFMLRNVKLGKPDPALFELPGKCHSMGDMMGEMMKGMP